MRERLGSGPRIVRALFAAILVLGFPIAIAMPQDLNGKVYASGAVVLIAAAGAMLAAALVRRRKEPSDESRAAAPRNAQDDPSGTGRWSLELLRRLEWRRFEELCTAYYEALGFTTTEARSGAEGGADIGLVAGGADQVSSVVQCKGWSVYTVGIKPVGVLRACGTFTSEAKEFSRGENIQLVDGAELLRNIGALPPEQGQALLKLAT